MGKDSLRTVAITESNQSSNMDSFRYKTPSTESVIDIAAVPSLGITRYGRRYWAVWFNGELLAVTLYLKGARAVLTAITNLAARPGENQS